MIINKSKSLSHVSHCDKTRRVLENRREMKKTRRWVFTTFLEPFFCILYSDKTHSATRESIAYAIAYAIAYVRVLVKYRPSGGRVAVKYRPSVGRHAYRLTSVDDRRYVDRVSADISAEYRSIYRPSVGRHISR